jgi:multiple antibiotic resistance protein
MDKALAMSEFSLFSITIVLFLIMDPVGNITAFLSLMSEVEEKKRKWVLIREILIAVAAMYLINYCGKYLIDVLEISKTTITLTSGLILFLVALKILFPGPQSLRLNLPKGEPFIIPLAIPLIAGPSLLATILLYAQLQESYLMMTWAIAIASLATYVVFLLAPFLFRVLGQNGLLALEKLMGMVLILIAVERFTGGLHLFIHTHGA